MTILLFKHILQVKFADASVHLNQIIPLPKYVRRIEQDEMWDEVHQISSQEYPSNLSDEVTMIRCADEVPSMAFRYTPQS